MQITAALTPLSTAFQSILSLRAVASLSRRRKKSPWKSIGPVGTDSASFATHSIFISREKTLFRRRRRKSANKREKKKCQCEFAIFSLQQMPCSSEQLSFSQSRQFATFFRSTLVINHSVSVTTAARRRCNCFLRLMAVINEMLQL